MGGMFGGDDDDYGCEDVPVKAAPKQEEKKVAKNTKPDFSTLINGQTSSGAWSLESQQTLASCIAEGESLTDQKVDQALDQFELKNGADRQVVFLTLLAWYILQESFAQLEDEWQLIVSKSKKWLESVGVSKPANIVKKFSLSLRA